MSRENSGFGIGLHHDSETDFDALNVDVEMNDMALFDESENSSSSEDVHGVVPNEIHK